MNQDGIGLYMQEKHSNFVKYLFLIKWRLNTYEEIYLIASAKQL